MKKGNSEFSDAIQFACVTCTFTEDETLDEIKMQLVNVRNRVSLTKTHIIPCLKLLSCLIDARLTKTSSVDLELQDILTVFGRDSTIAQG